MQMAMSCSYFFTRSNRNASRAHSSIVLSRAATILIGEQNRLGRARYRLTMTPSAEEHAYLESHVWGLLATGRSNGAPQLSMVAYDWDGTDVVISCRSRAAKFVNAERRDAVVFAVPDGVNNLTVTGTAVCHRSGSHRDLLTERLRDRLTKGHTWASDLLDNDMQSGLDEVDRVIIQIRPSIIHLIQPQG